MVPALHQMSLYVVRCDGNRILHSFAFSKQTFRSVPEEWEISGAYICEVITVRLIQQYE